ncbi:MAG: hypothetical protein E7005_03000 [Alphaproteobacteria bacterium]|nr:hypothetical protein [Alphaproteobacteria bacterium]
MGEITLESQLIDIIKDEDMAENIKVAKIDMLVRLGVDVNAMYGARSALKLANELNETIIAKMLEDNKARDFIDDEKAEELGTKLFDNCSEDRFDIKKIKELIDMGADVNQKDETGKTALMEASRRGHKEVVEFLIQKGADVNKEDDYGWTALMWTSRKGRNEIVELLIQNGADVNVKDYKGRNAVMVAYDNETKKAIMDTVKKRNEKTGENVVIQGFERE